MNENHRENLKLTRYLYLYDEVKYCLLLSIMAKSEFKEVLFWLSEMYESGFYEETWQYIFRLYYDLYHMKHPHFERFIVKQYVKWRENKEIKYLCKCVKNMYYKKYDTRLWYFSILSKMFEKSSRKKPKIKMFRGRAPSICQSFEKKHWKLIRSLEKNCIGNVVYYMNSYDECEFLNVLEKYINLSYGYENESEDTEDIHSECVCDMREIMKINQYYSNKKHRAFVEYMCIIIPDTQIDEDIGTTRIQGKKKKNIYILETNRDVEFFQGTCNSVTPVWKTLENRMLYPVHKYIGVFHSSRFSVDNTTLKELYWYNWELMCFDCPLWRKRFDEYGASMIRNDNGLYELVFKEDEKEDTFYDRYGYEFDEQTRETQSKVLNAMNILDYKDDVMREMFKGINDCDYNEYITIGDLRY